MAASKTLALVGLDPGTGTGLAVLDLEGNVLALHAGKQVSFGELISRIIEVSQPVIVSTDKANVPSLVAEFARKTGCRIVAPRQDISRKEKHLLFGKGYKGGHEEDALAAARFAYKKISPRLEKIRHFTAVQNIEQSREFTILALKEDRNFYAIKRELDPPGPEKEAARTGTGAEAVEKGAAKREIAGRSVMERKALEELEKKEQREQELLQAIGGLQKENRYLQRKSRGFYARLDLLLRFKEKRLKLQQRELQEQQEIITHLTEKIRSLYAFIEKAERYQLVKKLPTLGQREFTGRNAILQVAEYDVLYVENPVVYSQSVLEELQRKGVMIISPVAGSRPVAEAVKLVHFPEGLAAENDYFGLVDKEVLKKAGIDVERLDVEGMVREYKGKRREEVQAHS